VTVLPRESRGPVCRIRWWQPVHSGAGRDVWALDDVTVASSVYNMLWVDFTDHDLVTHQLNVRHGRVAAHCGRPSALTYISLC